MMHLGFFVFAVLTASGLLQSLAHGKPKSFTVLDTQGRICKCITHSDKLCKLLADSLESMSTSFLKTSKVESGHFGSCVSLL